MNGADDDRYGGGYDDAYGRDYGDGGGSGQTRLRLPDGEADGYAPPRRSRSGLPSRNVITIVGVVVLLIAAIAFANRGGGTTKDSTSHAAAPSSDSTAPTGVKPVQGSTSGFAHTQQGAQSAATNYAVALVSADILKPAQRHSIVKRIFAPDKTGTMQSRLDSAYSASFLKKLGLDSSGHPASGMTYVSRTVPIGARTTKYDKDTADVSVWCTGLFGTAGAGSKDPVTSDWFTMHFSMKWADGDWKTDSFSQSDGPAPVNGDNKVSDADQIASAVRQYGGFSYAR